MKKLSLAFVLIGSLFAGALLAREPETAPKITSQELLVEALAADPNKEVVAEVYSFPPGTVLPWHIHPGAQEVAYILSGTLTFEQAGKPPRKIKAGEAESLGPDIVHRGLNEGTEPVKLFVVRIKPKGTPLVQEVPPPAP